MKMNRIQKITAQVSKPKHTKIYLTSYEAKNKKFRKFIKNGYVHIMTWEPGPSKLIKYNKDGKVIRFLKWAGNKKQHTYTTEAGKASMNENKRIKENKKELIKTILQKAGYDPTIRYTRKEKKHFTRIVKKEISLQQILLRKEEPLKTYEYEIQRYKDSKPDTTDIEKQRVYTFAKDKFQAHTQEEAVMKLTEIANKWSKDSSFSGINLIDPNTGDKTYYPRLKWAA